MANPSTKVLSCRVPYDKYLEVIAKCRDCKLSINDYVALQIFGDDSKDKTRADVISKLTDLSYKVNEVTKRSMLNNISALLFGFTYDEHLTSNEVYEALCKRIEEMDN